MPESDIRSVGAAAAGHYGISVTGATLSSVIVSAAWNVQGNPADAAFVNGVQRLFDVPLPVVPNTTKRGNDLVALWLGPRSWLLVETAAAGERSGLDDFAAKRDAVNASGGALFDVSASRVAFRISGLQAARILAKSCPLDFHPDAFAVGQCAQSLVGRVGALFYRPDATPTFLMLVARSFSHDSWKLLCRSAAQYGYDVEAPHALADLR